MIFGDDDISVAGILGLCKMSSHTEQVNRVREIKEVSVVIMVNKFYFIMLGICLVIIMIVRFNNSILK